MHECFLPTAEETEIKINFADGQESIVVDAIDIDNLVKDCWGMKIPEDSDFELEFRLLFKRKYNRVLSKTAVNMLCGLKHKILEEVKKKLYGQPVVSDTTVSEAT